jgi:N-acetylneuraminic acid mutarotase
MVTARSETAAAVIDGLIYVPGGYGGRSVLEIYDPQADAWSTAASLPEGRDHAAVTALDGILYVIGGNEGETSLFAYDPVNDVWERRRRMPHQRTAAVALAHDGAVWVVGGTSDIVDDPTLREVLRYDPGTDAWTTEGSLSSNRHHHGSVVVDSAFWLFGGRHGLVSDTSTEIYDVVSGTSSVGETMAVGRGGFQSVIHRGLILAHGGDQLDDVPTLVATAEALDPTGGGWTETLELPVAVHGHAAAAVDDVLFIIGGSDFAGGVDNAGRVWALP